MLHLLNRFGDTLARVKSDRALIATTLLPLAVDLPCKLGNHRIGYRYQRSAYCIVHHQPLGILARGSASQPHQSHHPFLLLPQLARRVHHLISHGIVGHPNYSVLLAPSLHQPKRQSGYSNVPSNAFESFESARVLNSCLRIQQTITSSLPY